MSQANPIWGTPRIIGELALRPLQLKTPYRDGTTLSSWHRWNSCNAWLPWSRVPGSISFASMATPLYRLEPKNVVFCTQDTTVRRNSLVLAHESAWNPYGYWRFSAAEYAVFGLHDFMARTGQARGFDFWVSVSPKRLGVVSEGS